MADSTQTIETTTSTSTATATATAVVNVPQNVMSRLAGRRARRPIHAAGESYSDSLSCHRCYVKHLSKASVLAAEAVEEPDRYEEAVLCIGNIAAAEDHADALGLGGDRAALHDMRERVWSRDPSLAADLRSMAAAAYKAGIERERNERNMAEHAKAKREEDEKKQNQETKPVAENHAEKPPVDNVVENV